MDLDELRNESFGAPEPQEDLYKEYIQDSKFLIDEAASTLRRYQKGELQPLRFRKDFINKNLLGGHRPGDVLGIAGSSGHGKSTLLQEIEDDIFNKELNPLCDDYLLVRNNYEMSVFKLYLRELKAKMNKNITNLLGQEFTTEEEELELQIRTRESNPNVKYFQNPQDAQTWFKVMCNFLDCHKDKKHIIVTIDHIALVKQTAGGKKDGMDNFIECINLLRHIYKNVSFIILSQLNRNIEDRDNPRNSAPRKGDIYQSDFLFHLADTIIVVHNPYRLGLQEHMVVARNKYTHLTGFKTNPDKKTSTFKTEGNMFYHFIKMRETEDNTLQDLYIVKMKGRDYEEEYEPQEELPRYEPNAALFGDVEEEEDSPFR